VAADGIELPEHPLLRPGAVLLGQHPVHQTRHQVRAQGKPSGQVTLALMLIARALQKWSVRQDIGRRLDLTEELLRREQIASLP